MTSMLRTEERLSGFTLLQPAEPVTDGRRFDHARSALPLACFVRALAPRTSPFRCKAVSMHRARDQISPAGGDGAATPADAGGFVAADGPAAVLSAPAAKAFASETTARSANDAPAAARTRSPER